MELYKYVPPERVDILENLYIRFTQPSSLNDPGEFSVQIKKLINDDTLENTLDEGFEKGLEHATMIENLQKEFKNSLNMEFSKKDCEQFYNLLLEKQPNFFEEIVPQLKNLLTNVVKVSEPNIIKNFKTNIKDIMGVLSLSECNNDFKMWSHYGSNHSGFIIILNRNHQFFKRYDTIDSERYKLKKVTYSSKIPISENLCEDLTDEKIFFTKGEDWKHEKEWRIIRPLEKSENTIEINEEKIHLFKLPSDLIKGVIFGYKCCQEKRDEIKSIISNNRRIDEFIFQEAILDENEYRIIIKDII